MMKNTTKMSHGVTKTNLNPFGSNKSDLKTLIELSLD